MCTFRELGQRGAQFAGALRDAGVTERDVVFLHLGNCVEFLLAYYGCLQAGATVTLVNPLQPDPGLRKQIVETAAVAAVTQSAQLHTLPEAASGTSVRTIVMVRTPPPARDAVVAFEEFVAGYPPNLHPGLRPKDDVAHIAFTGGTTGVSKGVRVLHRNVVGNVTQMIGWRTGHELVPGADGGIELRPIDGLDVRGVDARHRGDHRRLASLPRTFVAQHVVPVDLRSDAGVRRSVRTRPDARTDRDAPRHLPHRVPGDVARTVATHPDAAIRNTDSVCVVSSGAAPIDSVTLEALRRAFPSASVVEGYGLTEATCLWPRRR